MATPPQVTLGMVQALALLRDRWEVVESLEYALAESGSVNLRKMDDHEQKVKMPKGSFSRLLRHGMIARNGTREGIVSRALGIPVAVYVLTAQGARYGEATRSATQRAAQQGQQVDGVGGEAGGEVTPEEVG